MAVAMMSVAMTEDVETRRGRGGIQILREPERDHVPETGAVSSVQVADVAIPRHVLERLWKPEYLERLARSYWLIRFRAPEYEVGPEGGAVTWRIERGLLVAPEGRGRGFLRIDVRRFASGRRGLRPPPGCELLRVRVEVRSFYPWIRGRGRFARFGTWLYSRTQLPIHVLVCRLFLRSLVRLDLPPAPPGAPEGEIVGPGLGEAAAATAADGGER
jgi:hypothetical protein